MPLLTAGSVLLFSHPRSEGCPHNGTLFTFSIYLRSLSFQLLFNGESCPRLDVVHLGCAWCFSPACTWHCSLHYLFLQATPLFPHGVTIVCYSGVNPNIFGGAIEAPSGLGQPPPQNFFGFLISKWRFVVHSWCIFCSSAKTLRERKDTLAQVYFYWGGGGNRPSPPRDRRHCLG